MLLVRKCLREKCSQLCCSHQLIDEVLEEANLKYKVKCLVRHEEVAKRLEEKLQDCRILNESSTIIFVKEMNAGN